MTHQTTLISSAPAAFSASHSLHASPPFLFNRTPSSPSSSPPSAAAAVAPAMASFVAHHHGSLGEREGRMAALRSSLRPCEAAEEVDAAPAAWGPAERGAGLFGDGFSVEDLLDLEDLCEVDKDCTELVAAAPAPAAVEDDKLSSDSHGSSVVSYELMPLPTPVIDLPLPAHDAEELEWVSRIMDDSQAELPPPPKLQAAAVAAAAARRPLERAVPAAAADPMRSPTICALSTEALVPVKARRSKRSRASVWSLSGGAPLSDSASSSSTATTSSCCSSASFSPFLFLPADSPPAFWAAHLLREAPRGASKKSKHGKSGAGGKPKRRGRKPKHHPASHQFRAASPAAGPGDRRCSHCGVQKTPQWRAGPAGAKTLCNACGVRYKSGRLLPEYRPACSPTFESSIHSNSHRKVLEMRRKKEGGVLFPPCPAPLPAAAPAVASF